MKKTILLLGLTAIMLACGTGQETAKTENTTTEAVEESPRVSDARQPQVQAYPVAASETVDQSTTATAPTTKPTEIEWMDFETAVNRNEKEPKFIFVDVYTHWCGWCKKMDATTFKDPKVVQYFNENVYAVKMDAESKTPIAYKGHLYEYKQVNQRAGYNTLAISLLDSRMSFPSFVILNKKSVKVGTLIGYQDVSKLISSLQKHIK